jgi:glycerol-3-phosphate dehydrogenase (NAD(P)+)
MRVLILGAGSWGAAMAVHLAEMNHKVSLWDINVLAIRQMEKNGVHNFLSNLNMPSNIDYCTEIPNTSELNIIIVAVPSHAVREVIKQIPNLTEQVTIVNLAKGIENNSLLRMSEVIHETSRLPFDNIVSLSGPSHAEEVSIGCPTAVVVGGTGESAVKLIQKEISSETFRIYTNSDVVGVELGGSVKNVIAIASGICDGIDFGDNTKAALITRGIVEIARLGVDMGAKAETFSGLSGIGDLIVTCLSRHSRNRYVGEEIGKGKKLENVVSNMKMVAEGVKTTKSVKALSKKYNVEMPICSAVHDVLFKDDNPKEAVEKLMTRDLISENFIL